MNHKESGKQTILGLDLGTSSIGWALVEGNPLPKHIIDMGVRIFPEGVDRTKGEKSLNQDRRDARSLRRQGCRRVRRKQKLLHALQDAKLLPKNPRQLDALMALNPYALRARALDERLESHELGRALYHLGQRRGFKSNRKTDSDKEDGKVYEGISTIDQEMAERNCRTLGEYFNGFDPHQRRIRGRYTSRRHYEEEFNKIWDAQLPHHPKQLDVNHRKRIREAIFDQRPLKIQKHLVGFCEFEPGRKRAAAATLVAQDFRLWQNLNNLKVTFADGSEHFLTDEERLTLGEKLATSKKLSWEQIRKALDFPERSSLFNLERTYKSGLMGNQSAALLSSALGKKIWKALGERKQEELVTDLLTITDEEGLLKRLRRHWRFDEEAIKKLLKVRLPKGYMHLSSKAMRNIVPHLKRAATEDNKGLTYADACKAAGYNHTKPQAEREDSIILFPGKAAHPKKHKGRELVPNHAAELMQPHIEIGELRNPMVERALYQVRRVVNALIRHYGKPVIIRVEMARDLKNNRRQREEAERKNRSNERLNEEARDKLQEYGIAHPSRSDLIKYRLWEECGHVCPYTGQSISMDALFGPEPQFDIEHIIPYRRCLDDSYMNKTLCERKENAAKGNLTPAEFYSKDEARYQKVLARAKSLPYPKFKRFALDAIKDLDDFVSQQLNETRYIARQAVAFLSQLGVKVEPVKGGTTALLRHAWGIGGLLSADGNKTRLDHRHHAVDALTVALTTRSAVQGLSTSTLRDGRLRLEEQRQPMPKLRQQAEEQLDKLVVSHKPQRKIKGPLHDETLYGSGVDEEGTPMAVMRMNIADLNEKDILGEGRKKIRDPNLRDLAAQRLKAKGSLKAAFADGDDPFGITSKAGEFRPVKKVRVLTERSITPIGSRKNNRRHVWTRSNHHMELFEVMKNGEPRWEATVVSTLEATLRKQTGKPIINTDGGDGRRFIMALHPNDMVKLSHNGSTDIYRVEKMDQNNNVSFRLHTDADKKDWRRAVRKSPESMRDSAITLLEMDALGKVK